MESLVLILAVAGALALIVRFLRALLRLGLRAAEVTSAAGMARISAQRGDLTGMAERTAALQSARRRRRRDLLLVLLWLLWLAVPTFADWSREAYALAAPLWLLPSRRTRVPPRP